MVWQKHPTENCEKTTTHNRQKHMYRQWYPPSCESWLTSCTRWGERVSARSNMIGLGMCHCGWYCSASSWCVWHAGHPCSMSLIGWLARGRRMRGARRMLIRIRRHRAATFLHRLIRRKYRIRDSCICVLFSLSWLKTVRLCGKERKFQTGLLCSSHDCSY